MEEETLKLKGDKQIPLGVMLKRTMKYLRPEALHFIIALILIAVNVALDVILPLFISKITDALQTLDKPFSYILWLVIAYLVISVVNQVFLYFESMLLQHSGQRIIYKMRMEVFSHIENMSQNQFDEMPVGSLVTRVASYTASMSDLFTNVLVNLLRNFLTVISVYGIMLYISWKLSLILLAFVVIIFVTSYLFGHVVGKVFRNERRYISELNTYLNENLSGMKIIQIFNQEKYKDDEFLAYNENLRRARYKVVIAFGIYRPFITLLQIFATAVIFFVGVKVGLTSGSIVAFYLYVSRFFNPIQNIADQLNNLQKALTASERLFNLLDVPPMVMDKEDAIDVPAFKGKIEFRNVWFAYNNDDWILKDVSFTINPGQTAAFVGATGAGKSTILGLLVRNYEIQKGQILIDDVDITSIKIESLRSKIGQMLQDVFLFSGTIRSNITLNDDSFTNEDIKSACDYVNASWFIDKLPKGIDEPVIERGENLSQGQRQLLSFARTVLHKPQILILDEATSNIDTETEVLIQESLQRMKSIGTMIVVAHRLSTIQHADKIICLSHGEIIEEGTHQELLKQKGYYYKLYLLQFEKR
jgi:ABC-type transport system, permease and ATPase components